MSTRSTPNVVVSASPLLNENEAAELLSVSPRTLQGWRIQGGGPQFIRISARCIRYELSAIHQWIEERRCRSTSEVVG